MKIKYQFATETVEIEVSDDWGNLVIDLDRQEYNNDHKETRRHLSLDAAEFEGEVFAVEDPSLEITLEQALTRINAQKDDDYYFSQADIIICTHSPYNIEDEFLKLEELIG